MQGHFIYYMWQGQKKRRGEVNDKLLLQKSKRVSNTIYKRKKNYLQRKII